jgi:Mg-chelatase subunit ChlD
MLGRFTTGTEGWIKYEATYTVPQNVKFVRIQLRSEVQGSVGNLVDDVVVSVTNGGNVNMTVSPNVTIKAGKTVDLQAQFDNPHAIERVNWLGSDQQSFDGSIITVSPSQTTTYLVRAWDVCGQQLPSKAVTVTVNGKTKQVVDDEPLNPVHVAKEPAANNIVLVLDISSSMALYDRMDLTKETIRQLIGSLRSQDRLTVIAFNFGTEIIQTPMVMDERTQKELLAKLEILKVGGGSNGEKALVEAYQLAAENFIKGGNNTVYLVSDGAFSYDKKSFGKEMKSRKKSGIALGIVAIQPRDNAFTEMNKIISISGGDVIVIKTGDEAKALLFSTLFS